MAFQGTVTGNLGRDPQLQYTQSGKAVINLDIGATPRQKNRDTNQWEDAGKPVWLRITLWEVTAERIANMQLSKGDQVAVTGTLVIKTFRLNDGTEGTSLELLNPRFLGAVPKQAKYGNPSMQGTQGAYGETVQWGNATSDKDPWETQEPAPF